MNSPADSPASSQGPTPIRILIIYENRDAAIRAKNVLDHVADSFQGEFAFMTEAWSFGMFRTPQLRDIVMRDADDAHLVVLAMEGQSTVPPEVMHGIKNGKSAALALLANNNDQVELPAIRSQLRHVARERSVDLLGDESHSGTGASPANSFNRMIQPPLLPGGSQFDPLHTDNRWGIND